jgi:hypothetical protein
MSKLFFRILHLGIIFKFLLRALICQHSSFSHSTKEEPCARHYFLQYQLIADILKQVNKLLTPWSGWQPCLPDEAVRRLVLTCTESGRTDGSLLWLLQQCKQGKTQKTNLDAQRRRLRRV